MGRVELSWVCGLCVHILYLVKSWDFIHYLNNFLISYYDLYNIFKLYFEFIKLIIKISKSIKLQKLNKYNQMKLHIWWVGLDVLRKLSTQT